jgi:hypothetical protein
MDHGQQQQREADEQSTGKTRLLLGFHVPVNFGSSPQFWQAMKHTGERDGRILSPELAGPGLSPPGMGEERQRIVLFFMLASRLSRSG